MTTQEILDQLGGYKKVAEALGLNRTTVYKWLENGIPALRWLQIERLAERQGLTHITRETIMAASLNHKKYFT